MSTKPKDSEHASTAPLPKETRAAVQESADPNQRVELAVYDLKNAGRTVNSRFGEVAFDGTGHGKVVVTLRDVELIHQLGWLTAPDKEKYLGLVPPEDPEVVKQHRLHKEQMGKAETYFQEMRGHLDSLERANDELRSANSELTQRVSTLTEENEALRAALAQEQQRVVTAASAPAAAAPATPAKENTGKTKS